MTAMAMTILMQKRERDTGDTKRVNQTCTEVVLRGVQATDYHSPTRGQIRATDFELGKPLTHRGQNPGGKLRATDLELGNPNTGGQNLGGKIWATDLGFGKAVTDLNNKKTLKRKRCSGNLQ